jgi:hypothetical protein
VTQLGSRIYGSDVGAPSSLIDYALVRGFGGFGGDRKGEIDETVHTSEERASFVKECHQNERLNVNDQTQNPKPRTLNRNRRPNPSTSAHHHSV